MIGQGYAANMRTAAADITDLIHSSAEALVGALRRACSDGLDVDELTQVLSAVSRQRNRIDSAVSGVIGTLDRVVEQAADQGDLTMGMSCATWLSHNLQISSSAAHAQVEMARRLPGLPATAGAFERGDLSPLHTSAVLRSVEQVARGGGDAGLAERAMLHEAGQRDPRNLLRWGLGLLHRLAPEEMEAEEERRHRRRYLRLSEVYDGGYTLEGYLDPEAGARFKVALDGVLGPRQKGDERSPGERRADGLDELVGRVLDSGELPERGGQRPHIAITATLDTLLGNPGAPAAELDWGFPISGVALRRIACDAELTPILLAANGDPLYVGRTRRTAPPRLRRALEQRDRRCIWPGCNRPPEQCDGHHERLWANGGRTGIKQMHLLCRRHHRMVHTGYRLERRPDGRVEVVPPERPGLVFGPAIHAPPPAA